MSTRIVRPSSVIVKMTGNVVSLRIKEGRKVIGERRVAVSGAWRIIENTLKNGATVSK